MEEIYTKFLNFVKLNVEIPNIYRTKEKPQVENFYRRRDGFYYLWGEIENPQNYDSIPPYSDILRDIISFLFCKKLEEKERYWINQKVGNYYVLDKERMIPHEFEDIFKIYRGFEYRIRSEKGTFYLAVDYKIKFQPVASVSELIKKDVSQGFFRNSTVIFSQNDRQSKGWLEKIENKTVKIKGFNGIEYDLNLDKIYPEPRTYVFDRILKELGRTPSAVFLQRKASFLNIKEAPRRRIEEIRKIFEDLKKLCPIENNGFRIDFENNFIPVFDIQTKEEGEESTEKERLFEQKEGFFYGNSIPKEPYILFDEEDTSKCHYQPSYGLKFFGPYSKRKISNITVSMIYPPDKKEKMRELFRILKEGDGRFFLGMKQMFRTQLELSNEIPLDGISPPDYEKACKAFLSTTHGDSKDVLIVWVPEEPRQNPFTPYYSAKRVLLEEGYTSQMVTHKTFESLNYSLLNLASAIYAKAGGTPWVLERELKDVDLVVGLSWSQLNPERALRMEDTTGLNRYVGFVNIFDQYGKWLFFQGNAYPYYRNNIVEAFKNLLGNVINKFEQSKGIKPKKFAFHYSQSFSRELREAIIGVVRKQSPDSQLAFLSINDNHPFRAFDLSTGNGSLSRRSYIYLNNNQYLLSTTGFSDIGPHGIGTPKLLHIIDYEYPEKFLGPEQIVEQVFALTKLNWASATPLIREPVSIRFSKSIAYTAASMNISSWKKINEPVILKSLEGKTWFL